MESTTSRTNERGRVEASVGGKQVWIESWQRVAPPPLDLRLMEVGAGESSSPDTSPEKPAGAGLAVATAISLPANPPIFAPAQL